jgi:ribosomal protein L11 methyltransferase
VIELWTSLGNDTDLIVSCLTEIGLPAEPGPQSGQPMWWRSEEISDATINSWRDHAQPFEIVDNVWVIPEWIISHDDDLDTGHFLRNQIPEDALQVIIDPGSAFGMGDHPTTRLSLTLLLRSLHEGDHILDLGCGSGILGIVALLAGAGHVTAIDISPAAREASLANALINEVSSQIDVSMTPLSELISTAEGVTARLAPVRIIVANILAPALISLAEDMLRACSEDSLIILSGILSDNYAHVIEVFSPWAVIDRVDEAGWTALLLAGPSHAVHP